MDDYLKLKKRPDLQSSFRVPRWHLDSRRIVPYGVKGKQISTYAHPPILLLRPHQHFKISLDKLLGVHFKLRFSALKEVADQTQFLNEVESGRLNWISEQLEV